MAEDVLRLVSQGTHSYDKFVKPTELLAFFRDELKWISSSQGHNLENLPFSQVEFRGMMYLPWAGKWTLSPRGMPLGMDVNYLFWARKPNDN